MRDEWSEDREPEPGGFGEMEGVMANVHGILRNACLQDAVSIDEEAERGEQRPLEERAISGEAAEFDFRFFEAVDVVVNALQFLAICGAIKLGVGDADIWPKHFVIGRLKSKG